MDEFAIKLEIQSAIQVIKDCQYDKQEHVLVNKVETKRKEKVKHSLRLRPNYTARNN